MNLRHIVGIFNQDLFHRWRWFFNEHFQTLADDIKYLFGANWGVLTLYPLSKIFTLRNRRVSSQWTPFRYSLSITIIHEFTGMCHYDVPTHLLRLLLSSHERYEVRYFPALQGSPWQSLTCLGIQLADSTVSCLREQWVWVKTRGSWAKIPWCARSEKAVFEEGDRLRAAGALPEGRRSRARSGCGDVTTGLVGTEEFDLELVRGVWK